MTLVPALETEAKADLCESRPARVLKKKKRTKKKLANGILGVRNNSKILNCASSLHTPRCHEMGDAHLILEVQRDEVKSA